MVEVFVWRKQMDGWKKLAVGHASMRVSYDDETGCRVVYMSWWPTGKGNELGGSPAYKIRTFDQDCDAEGHKPDRSFVFNDFFKETEIIAAWNKWKTDLQYQMMFRSCCSLVRTMMCSAGLIEKYPQFVNFCTWNFITTPDEIEFYCNQLEIFLRAAK